MGRRRTEKVMKNLVSVSQGIDDLVDDLVFMATSIQTNDTLYEYISIIELKLQNTYNEILNLRMIIDKGSNS